ncbi:MAG: hypothetical protein WCG73_01070 [Candidatus Moraniibacteriota bacterium]
MRQFRLGEYAIFDFVVTFLGIYLLSSFLSKIFLKIRISIPRSNWLFLALPMSILIHLLSGKITPLTRDFINIQDHYFLKVCILALFVFGLRGIKRVEKNISKTEK